MPIFLVCYDYVCVCVLPLVRHLTKNSASYLVK